VLSHTSLPALLFSNGCWAGVPVWTDNLQLSEPKLLQSQWLGRMWLQGTCPGLTRHAPLS
jgi:hypothetical protein